MVTKNNNNYNNKTQKVKAVSLEILKRMKTNIKYQRLVQKKKLRKDCIA